MKKYLVITFLLSLYLQVKPQSITWLKKDMYGIAADATEGRFTASAGYLKAAKYVAAQLKAAGIKPGCTENNKSSYLQPVPFSWDDYTGSELIINNKVYKHDAQNFIIIRRGIAKTGKWVVASAGKHIDGNPAGIIRLPGQDKSNDWETTVIRQYRFGYMHYLPDSTNTPKGIPAIMVSPELAKLLTEGDSLHVTLRYESENKTGYNVIGIVQGTDTPSARNTIIVGAHLDHLGHIGKHIYNGANDDASGCVAALGAARMLAAHPGKHTVIFTFFCGEELDLKGSHWFADHLPVPQSDISMMINLEQLGSIHRSFNGVWALGDTVFKPLFYKAGRDFFTLQHLQFSAIDSVRDILRDTDTYSFMNKHIPSVLLASGGFPEHHTPGDKINLIDFKHLQKATLLLKELIGQ